MIEAEKPQKLVNPDISVIVRDDGTVVVRETGGAEREFVISLLGKDTTRHILITFLPSRRGFEWAYIKVLPATATFPVRVETEDLPPKITLKETKEIIEKIRRGLELFPSVEPCLEMWKILNGINPETNFVGLSGKWGDKN